MERFAYMDGSVQVVPETSLPETTCWGSAAVSPNARGARKRDVKCMVGLFLELCEVVVVLWLVAIDKVCTIKSRYDSINEWQNRKERSCDMQVLGASGLRILK